MRMFASLHRRRSTRRVSRREKKKSEWRLPYMCLSCPSVLSLQFEVCSPWHVRGDSWWVAE